MERPLPAEGQTSRIAELWAWTTIDPMTDTEGIIGMRTAGGGAIPMVTSIATAAEQMRPFAEAVVAAAEAPRPVLRLRHFVAVD